MILAEFQQTDKDDENLIINFLTIKNYLNNPNLLKNYLFPSDL